MRRALTLAPISNGGANKIVDRLPRAAPTNKARSSKDTAHNSRDKDNTEGLQSPPEEAPVSDPCRSKRVGESDPRESTLVQCHRLALAHIGSLPAEMLESRTQNSRNRE